MILQDLFNGGMYVWIAERFFDFVTKLYTIDVDERFILIAHANSIKSCRYFQISNSSVK